MMQQANPLMTALQGGAYALDTPGRTVRSAIAGNDLGAKTSGEDMLRALGIPSNAIAGLLAEIGTDPMAIAGGAGAAGKIGKGGDLMEILQAIAPQLLQEGVEAGLPRMLTHGHDPNQQR